MQAIALVHTAVPLSAQEIDPLLPGRLRAAINAAEAKQPATFLLAVSVADAKTGEAVFEHNAARLQAPASVLKIITSFAALKFLGSNYRFPTEVFVDSLRSDQSPGLDLSAGVAPEPASPAGTGNLYLRGYGDPSLTEDDLWTLAVTLAGLGLERVEHIVVDHSLFVEPPPTSGPRPYQAALSATSLNLNCYRVRVAPGSSGSNAFVTLNPGAPYVLDARVKTLRKKGSNISIVQSPPSALFNPAKPQAKLDGFSQFDADPVSILVKGRIGSDEKVVEEHQSVPYPPHYFAATMRYMLEKAGVKAGGSLLQGETPASARLLHVHESAPLHEIIRQLNHESSNFVAGQLAFALGQDSAGYFQREIGLTRIRSVLESLGYTADSFVIADASGLDRASRLTAAQLTAVLVAAFRDFSIAPDFIASLSRFSHSGTLKKRELLRAPPASLAGSRLYLEQRRRADGVWGKTGTLDGVRSLAGYAETRTGRRVAYTILTTGAVDKQAATDVEETIIKELVEIGS